MGWLPWQRVNFTSPLTANEVHEALLGNVPQVFRGQVAANGFQLTRAPLVITGQVTTEPSTRIRVTMRLAWRAYAMLPCGVLAFPVLLGNGLQREQGAGWVLLLLAGFAFVLSGVSPVWRFHRSARWSEQALRAIFGAQP